MNIFDIFCTSFITSDSEIRDSQCANIVSGTSCPEL